MPAVKYYAKAVAQLEIEIVRKGVILSIDWNDATVVRNLARQVLNFHEVTFATERIPSKHTGMAMLELFGLAQLMLNVMKESADDGIEAHGGTVWKSLGRALWEEARMGRDVQP